MKTKTLLIVTLVSAIIFAGCSTTKVSKSGPMAMKYKFETGKSYKYHYSSDAEQRLDFNGQIVDALSSEVTAYTITSDPLVNGTYKLTITLDTLIRSQSGMMGSVNPDLSALFGKSFTMTISEFGEEGNLAGDDKISYKNQGQEVISLANTFNLLFPDFDGKPSTIGYKWTEVDTAYIKNNAENTTFYATTENTIAGNKKVNGYDCLLVTYTFAGSRQSSMSTEQGELFVIGDIKGSGEYCFAPEQGVLVSDFSTLDFNGRVEVMGGVFPITIHFNVKHFLK